MKPETPPKWLTRREAAEHLRCSTETLDDWRKGPMAPPEHHTPGGRPLFDRDELDAWLRSRCTTTPAKPSRKARRADPDDVAELVG